MSSLQDQHYMHMALTLAGRGLGRVWPNPAVGCVIVKHGVVVGRGWTADGGRPHAENIALERAGHEAKGATAYVSLEPCAHHGETPPCAKGLIEAGIKRVVVACVDPDSRVSGQGIDMLKEAGIEVETGVLEEEAKALNAGFILRVTQNRPFVTLKSATSADGKIAAEPGAQTRITGDLAHRRAHLIRSRHDAILVGIGTVLADDPALTARVPGLEHNIVRVVLDSNLRIPVMAMLLKDTVATPLFILHNANPSLLSPSSSPSSSLLPFLSPSPSSSSQVSTPAVVSPVTVLCKIQEEAEVEKSEVELKKPEVGPRKAGLKLEKAGAKLIQVDTRDIGAVLGKLADLGITRLLVEGGAQVNASFLEAGFCDQFLWFRAPQEIGSGGLDALPGRDIADIEADFGLEKQKTVALGEDLLEIYTKF